MLDATVDPADGRSPSRERPARSSSGAKGLRGSSVAWLAGVPSVKSVAFIDDSDGRVCAVGCTKGLGVFVSELSANTHLWEEDFEG
jgi:hypothetical protein